MKRWRSVTLSCLLVCLLGVRGRAHDDRPNPILVLNEHGGPIRSVGYSADGKSLFTAGGTSISLWDLKTGKKIRDVHQGAELSYGIVWSRDRTRIAFGLDGGSKVRVIEADTGKEIRTISRPDSGSIVFSRYALSPNGQILAAENSSPPTVYLWSIPSGKKLHELHGPEGVEFGFAFSPDGSILALGGDDGTCRLWDVQTGKEIRRFVHPLRSDRVRHLAFSPDGCFLATAVWGTHDILCLWDVHSGKMLKKLGQDHSEAMAEFDKQFREATEKGIPFDEKKERSKRLNRLCIDGLAFSPDGRWLATAGEDGFIRLWELATGKEGASWATPYPLPLAFSPDGKTLTSAGREPDRGWPTSVALWDRAAISRKGRRIGAILRDKELESYWRELSSEDAGHSCQAVWILASSPLQMLTKVDAYLQNAPVAAPEDIRHAVAALDSKRFHDREEAFRKLTSLGERAKPVLIAAQAGQLGTDARKRIETLLQTINDPRNPERLRHARLVETLEQVGNIQAQAMLKRIESGVLGETAAKDAKATLKRVLNDSRHP